MFDARTDERPREERCEDNPLGTRSDSGEAFGDWRGRMGGVRGTAPVARVGTGRVTDLAWRKARRMGIGRLFR